ncbi:MAG: hypothetical protein J6A01_08505 [Proteobacteria bacterium]|nr:hypothetical protein [Pseudomonadota bacterium]
MRKGIYSIAIILAGILCVSGCNDENNVIGSNNDVDSSDECKTNTKICANGIIYKCVDNSFVEESECKSHACLNASECKLADSSDPVDPPNPPAPQCEDSEPSCHDGEIQSCQDGNLIIEKCESGACLDETSCKVACTADVCSEGILQKCEENFLTAPITCDTGACFDETSCKVACTTDACSDGFLQKCENGTLIAPVACDTGACFDEKSCKVACTTDVCNDGVLQKCEDNTLSAPAACDSGACLDEKSCKVACTEDACSNGFLQKCEGGFLSLPTACDSGACKNAASCATPCTAHVCTGDTFTKCVNGAASDPVKCQSGKCGTNTCIYTEDFESGKLEGSKKKVRAHGKQDTTGGYEADFYPDGTYTSKAVTIDGENLKWSAKYANIVSPQTWPWTEKRKLTSKGIALLRYENPSSLSATLPNGIGSISLQAQPWYTCSINKARVLIYINGKNCNSDAKYKTDGKYNYVEYKCDNVNQPGPVELEIQYDGYYSVDVDDITWTDYFE